MSDKNTGWSVDGAISVLLDAPMPGSDMVFAPDFETVKSARQFLESQYSEKDIQQLLGWGMDRRMGRPLREF